MLNIPKTLRSFTPATAGIKLAIAEANMRMHLLTTIVVILLGWYFKLSPGEWAVIALSISMVMAMEIINTAIEDVANNLRDRMNLDYEATRNMRDLAAGAVLFSAIGALIIGLIVFLPKIYAVLTIA